MISDAHLTMSGWRKSSYSNGDGGNCLEVADDMTARVGLRDSKSPDGPELHVREGQWAAFVAAVKTGTLLRP
ncbi:DUF397 domain-containing protein [Streptomyces sp. NBC_01497]|uniref:DUF397 domain-containing protein n=1 Tax=Streptomyces sp. NBC_01497 TaxID=2903885 RepID=UPI002E37AFA7|nr:DUF397 domain-containing protein [Streptomyces sp. NBC_01497]